MIQLKERDIVKCRRASNNGDDLKIIDIRRKGTNDEELRLQNVVTNEILGWFYTVHVTYDSREIIRKRKMDNLGEAQRILNKKKKL
jgi:hypothetical protein